MKIFHTFTGPQSGVMQDKATQLVHTHHFHHQLTPFPYFNLFTHHNLRQNDLQERKLDRDRCTAC
jgi:hypothetical protein